MDSLISRIVQSLESSSDAQMAGALIAIQKLPILYMNFKAIVADLFKKAAKGVVHSAERWTNFIQQEFDRMKELDCELTKEGGQPLTPLTQKYIFFFQLMV